MIIDFRKPGWAERSLKAAIRDLPRLHIQRPADEAPRPEAVDQQETHATAGGDAQ